jgi:hypothetical protein
MHTKVIGFEILFELVRREAGLRWRDIVEGFRRSLLQRAGWVDCGCGRCDTVPSVTSLPLDDDAHGSHQYGKVGREAPIGYITCVQLDPFVVTAVTAAADLPSSRQARSSQHI